jgi:predicted ferric reductase
LSSDVILWELIRASGFVAYILLSAGVALGVAVRVRALDWLMRRAWVYDFHQVISILALVFTVLHVALLLVNDHVPFNFAGVLLPFSSDWRPLASALGIGSLYLLALLTASSYVRARIGQKTWRAIHYGGFLAWVMALGHGLSAGSDTDSVWVQYLYLGTGSLVGFLTLFRLLEVPGRPATEPSRARPDNAPSSETGNRSPASRPG